MSAARMPDPIYGPQVWRVSTPAKPERPAKADPMLALFEAMPARAQDPATIEVPTWGSGWDMQLVPLDDSDRALIDAYRAEDARHLAWLKHEPGAKRITADEEYDHSRHATRVFGAAGGMTGPQSYTAREWSRWVASHPRAYNVILWKRANGTLTGEDYEACVRHFSRAEAARLFGESPQVRVEPPEGWDVPEEIDDEATEAEASTST